MILGIFGILLMNISCQRDDICPASTPTTPEIDVFFFDFEEREIPKPPANLQISIPDSDSTLNITANSPEISIPLRTGQNSTVFDFILNSTSTDSTNLENPRNVDRVLFSYGREEEYINRACGYKVNYLNLQAELLSVETEDDAWIREILIVEEDTLENETNTRILIYH